LIVLKNMSMSGTIPGPQRSRGPRAPVDSASSGSSERTIADTHSMSDQEANAFFAIRRNQDCESPIELVFPSEDYEPVPYVVVFPPTASVPGRNDVDQPPLPFPVRPRPLPDPCGPYNLGLEPLSLYTLENYQFHFEDGYCYLALVPHYMRQDMQNLGPYPSAAVIHAYLDAYEPPIRIGSFTETSYGVYHFLPCVTDTNCGLFSDYAFSPTAFILSLLPGSVGGKTHKKKKNASPKKEEVPPATLRVGSTVARLLMRNEAENGDRFDFVYMPWGPIPSLKTVEKYRWWYEVDLPFERVSTHNMTYIGHLVHSLVGKLDSQTEIDACIRYLDKLRSVLRTRKDIAPHAIDYAHPSNGDEKVEDERRLYHSKNIGSVEPHSETASHTPIKTANDPSLMIHLGSCGLVAASCALLRSAFRYDATSQDSLVHTVTPRDNAFMQSVDIEPVTWADTIKDLAAVFLILKSVTSVEDLTSRLLGIAILRRKDLEIYIRKALRLLKDKDLAENSDSTIQAEALDDPEKISHYLHEFRNLKEGFSTSKIGIFLKSVVAGAICSSFVEDDVLLQSRLEMLDKLLPGESLRHEDAFELLLNVITYTVEFLEVAQNNPDDMMNFLLPASCSRRMAWIRAHTEHFMAATLEKVNSTPNEFAREVTQIRMDLCMTLAAMKRRDKYSLRTITTYSMWLTEIDNLTERMKMTKYAHSPRMRPWCVLFYGGSSIAKSILVEQYISFFCRVRGLTTSEEIIWRANNGKYDDGHIESKKIYVFDDVANGKLTEQNIEKQDVCKITHLVNNTPWGSEQSEADKKGAHFHIPELIVMTSNIPDLKCLQYSNYPESMWNRIQAYNVTLKPQFELSDHSLNQAVANSLVPLHRLAPMVPDFARITTSRDNKTSSLHMDIIENERKDIEHWMPIWKKQWNEHFNKQDKIMKELKILKDVEICEHDILKCFCTQCRIKYPSGSAAAQINESKELLSNSSSGDVPTQAEAISDGTLSFMQCMYDDFVDWIARLPLPRVNSLIGNWLGNLSIRAVKSYVELIARSTIPQKLALIAFSGIGTAVATAPVVYTCYHEPVAGACLVVANLSIFFTLLCHVKAIAAQCIVAKVRYGMFSSETTLGMGMKVVGFMLVAKQLLRFAQDFSNPVPQGIFTQTPMENIKEPSSGIWDSIKSFVSSEKKGTSTLDERHRQYYKRLFEVKEKGKVLCHAYAHSREVLLVPNHWYTSTKCKESLNIGLYGRSTDNRVVHVMNSINPPGTDWCYLLLDTQLEVQIKDQLLTSDLGHNSGFYPDVSGKWTVRSLEFGEFTNGVSCQLGYKAAGVHTQKGMCMQPVFATAAPYKIIAFHMGGTQPHVLSKYGVAHALTADMAFQHLDSSSMIVPHSTRFDQTTLGKGKLKEVSSPTLLHRHSCFQSEYDTNPLVKEKTLTVLGALNEGVKPKSKIEPALLQSFLPEEMNKFGPPRFLRHRDYQNSWTKIQNKMTLVPRWVVDKAVDDYASSLCSDIPDELREGPVKLSFSQAINGLFNDRFLNKVDIRTSGGPGYPKKEEMIWRESPDSPLQWLPELEDISMKILGELESGHQVLFRVATALKDEIVVREEFSGKRKVRLFYIFPTPALLVGKMLFARLNSYCTANPVKSGLVGGMNHTREDWGELLEIMERYTFAFDSDYSGYDTSQSAQSFMALKAVLCSVLPQLGYTTRETRACLLYLDAMRDAPVEFNLALVQFYGVLKSGVWITLLANGMVNNILYRFVYFIILGENAPPFLEGNFLAAQGDDAMLATNLKEMDPKNVFEAFNSFNMKVTPGRKTGVIQFRKAKELSFCKRGFRIINWRGKTFVESPIELDSIWKPLFWKNSDLSITDHCLANLTPFFLELSRHEEKVYDYNANILWNALKHPSAPGTELKEIPSWNYRYWIDRRLSKVFPELADAPSDDKNSGKSEVSDAIGC